MITAISGPWDPPLTTTRMIHTLHCGGATVLPSQWQPTVTDDLTVGTLVCASSVTIVGRPRGPADGSGCGL